MTAPSSANGAGGTATVTTRYAYDANGRLCRVLENASVDLQGLTDPCTTTVSGNTPSNVSTTYDYYPTGLLWHQYAPSPAGTTTYAYDAQGHLTGESDADGNSTSWTYDAQGNKTSETDPDTTSGPTVSYAYDAAGRLCRRVAANPGVVLQSYGSPCTSGVTGATVDTRYTLDNAGNTLTVNDVVSGQTITSTYDQLSRPLSVSGDTTGDPATTYSYDFNNPTRTDPSGSYTGTLDAYGRQTQLLDPLHSSGNLYTWSYAPSGAVSASTDPTGNATSFTYDPLGRLTASSTTGGSGCTTCAVYAYAYNSAGNQLTKTSTISGDTTNGTTTYAYDQLSRLTSYTPPTATPAQTYTWNGLPDRASIKVGTGTPVTTTFDAASRPTVDSASNTYTSDKEGRITGIPGKTLVYDALGRLVQVKTAPGGTVLATYTYDPLDRLRTITAGSITDRFRYVGLTTAVAQIIDNGSGTVISNHATDLNGIELYDFTSGGVTQTYLGRNGHGDVTWTASTTGAVTAQVAYDPYGNLVASSGTVPATRWQGSYYDGSSGLYYVNARWYAPSLGTFVSQDPLAGKTADPQSRDPYSYIMGNPIGGVDPFGTCSFDRYTMSCVNAPTTSSPDSRSMHDPNLASVPRTTVRARGRGNGSPSRYKTEVIWLPMGNGSSCRDSLNAALSPNGDTTKPCVVGMMNPLAVTVPVDGHPSFKAAGDLTAADVDILGPFAAIAIWHHFRQSDFYLHRGVFEVAAEWIKKTTGLTIYGNEYWNMAWAVGPHLMQSNEALIATLTTQYAEANSAVGIAKEELNTAFDSTVGGAAAGCVSGLLAGAGILSPEGCVGGALLGGGAGLMLSPIAMAANVVRGETEAQRLQKQLTQAQSTSQLVLGCDAPNCVLQGRLDRSDNWSSTWDR